MAGPPGAARSEPRWRHFGGCEPPAPSRLGERTVWNKTSDALCRPEDRRGGAAFALATRLPRELHLPRRLLSPSSGKSSSVPEPTPLPARLGQAAQSGSGRLSSVRHPASRLDEVARVPLSVPARFHCTLVADWTTSAGVFRRGPPLRYSTRPPNASRRPSGRAEKMHLSDVCTDRSTLRAPDRNRPDFPRLREEESCA